MNGDTSYEIAHRLGSGSGPRVSIEATIFLVLAVYFVGAAIAYGILADEDAGTVMLALTAVFSAVIGVLLVRHPPPRRGERVPELQDEGPAEEGMYLPQASFWPLPVGWGLVLTVGGLALGIWVLIPGLLLTIRGVIGFMVQSRLRT